MHIIDNMLLGGSFVPAPGSTITDTPARPWAIALAPGMAEGGRIDRLKVCVESSHFSAILVAGHHELATKGTIIRTTEDLQRVLGEHLASRSKLSVQGTANSLQEQADWIIAQYLESRGHNQNTTMIELVTSRWQMTPLYLTVLKAAISANVHNRVLFVPTPSPSRMSDQLWTVQPSGTELQTTVENCQAGVIPLIVGQQRIGAMATHGEFIEYLKIHGLF